MKIQLLNESDFNKHAAFFNSDGVVAQTSDFFSFIVTSCVMYKLSADHKLLNQAIAAGRLTNRTRLVKRIVGMVAAHTVGKSGLYVGKANAKKMARELDTDDFIAKVKQLVAQDAALQADKKEQAEYDWAKASKSLQRMVAKALENGVELSAIVELARTTDAAQAEQVAA